MRYYDTKDEFIAAYVVDFLSSYAAAHYDDNCLRGWPNHSRVQPVEDAFILAEEAWQQLQEFLPTHED